jgi:chorismate mutase
MESKEVKAKRKNINKQVGKNKTNKQKSFKDINRERQCTNQQ